MVMMMTLLILMMMILNVDDDYIYVDIGDDIMMSSSEACHEMVAITHLHIHDSSACLGAIVIVFFMIFIMIVIMTAS